MQVCGDVVFEFEPDLVRPFTPIHVQLRDISSLYTEELRPFG